MSKLHNIDLVLSLDSTFKHGYNKNVLGKNISLEDKISIIIVVNLECQSTRLITSGESS